jgi:nitric oxide dioxygenase
VPAYQPGQYTTVLAQLPASISGTSAVGEAYTQPRQYSLSKSADNKSFRITVKREDPLPTASGAAPTKPVCPFTGGSHAKAAPGSLAGVVSTWVHSSLQVGSVVDLAPPFGEFVLQPGKGPVVLLAAGVGLTPMIPMLETAAAMGRRVSLLYATHSSNKHPLRSWFAGYRGSKGVSAAASSATPDSKPATVKGGPADVTLKVWYEAPMVDKDTLGVTHDYTGRIELDKLSEAEQARMLSLDSKDADYYVCGPPQFMQAQLAQLRKLCVPENRLHSEVFGAGAL